MRFWNRTNVDQVVDVGDWKNRKTVAIPAGGVVEGEEFSRYVRPSGPLTPDAADGAGDLRKQFSRVSTHTVKSTLAPFYQSVLREQMKGRLLSSTQALASIAQLFQLSSFDEFINRRVLTHVTNTTLAADSVGVIVARLEEGMVLHAISEAGPPKSSTVWASGARIGTETWRRATLADGAGDLRKRDGYAYEPPPTTPELTNPAPADLSAWSALIRIHRDEVINSIAQAVFDFVRNDKEVS